MNATGQLRHHFWGTYAATIVLRFENETDASLALTFPFTSPPWVLHPDRPNVLVFHGSGPELEQAIGLLAQYGADPDRVQSVAKSIDYGEQFTITIDGTFQAWVEACGQQRLAFETASAA